MLRFMGLRGYEISPPPFGSILVPLIAGGSSPAVKWSRGTVVRQAALGESSRFVEMLKT